MGEFFAYNPNLMLILQTNEMLVLPVIAALLSGLLIAVMLGMKASLPLDHPNHRSLHDTPTPRTGGAAILLAVASVWLWLWNLPGLLPLLATALALAVVGLLDDFKGLPASARLAVQFAVAAAWLAFFAPFSLSLALWPVGLLALVWMANLFNFMDGSDGLAGGMALIGFGGLAVAAGLAGADGLATAAACLSGAALGFLWFNFHPARIFMGDVGSVPLGFLAAGLGLVGWRQGLWPVSFPLLVFSPFIADASVTLLKRLLRGEKVWQAHREHYYQRLIQMGLGHRNMALWAYGLMLACGLSGLLSLHWDGLAQVLVLAGWAMAYLWFFRRIDLAWANHRAGVAA